MPVTNTDASQLTRQRRAMALAAFNTTAVNVNGQPVRREQVNTQTLDIVVARNLGICYCASFPNYANNGGCGCNITR